jgi:hypothetical protein
MHMFYAGVVGQKMQADLLVTVYDAAMRAVPIGTEIDPDIDGPLSYPKSMRTECLVLSAINLPSGENETIVETYEGGEGMPVVWKGPPDMQGGHYENNLSLVVMNGWKKAAAQGQDS